MKNVRFWKKKVFSFIFLRADSRSDTLTAHSIPKYFFPDSFLKPILAPLKKRARFERRNKKKSERGMTTAIALPKPGEVVIHDYRPTEKPIVSEALKVFQWNVERNYGNRMKSAAPYKRSFH